MELCDCDCDFAVRSLHFAVCSLQFDVFKLMLWLCLWLCLCFLCLFAVGCVCFWMAVEVWVHLCSSFCMLKLFGCPITRDAHLKISFHRIERRHRCNWNQVWIIVVLVTIRLLLLGQRNKLYLWTRRCTCHRLRILS